MHNNLSRQAKPVRQNQICQCKPYIHFANLFSQAPVACLLESQLLLHNSKDMLNFSSYRRFFVFSTLDLRFRTVGVVLVPSGNLLGTPSITEESERLGKLMVDAVSNETGTKNRGITGRSDLTGFNFSEIPTVLIEMGFMSNPDEDAMLSTDSYQDKIVSGIANSLLSWYGVEYEP